MYSAMSSPAACEHRQRLLDERGQRSPPRASGSRSRRNMPPWTLPQSSAIRSPAAAARSARESARRSDVVGPACPEQGFAELDLDGEVELGRRDERGGALEQADGGAVVLAEGCARSAAGRQPSPRRGGQGAVVGRPELGPVAAGLLEVVAEDLVQLDELGAVLLEPGREALVEVRAGRLRQRVVGRVADQEVAEAEGVLAGELRPCPSRISSLRTSAARRGVTWRLVGCERLDGAAVEDLALDRAPLEHAPLGRLELIEARAEQRPQRGRHDDVTAPRRRRSPASPR